MVGVRTVCTKVGRRARAILVGQVVATAVIGGPVAHAQELTGTVVPITAGATPNGWPSISADGLRIVWEASSDGTPEIRLFDGRTQTTTNLGTGWFPVISGDGSQVVFFGDCCRLLRYDVASGIATAILTDAAEPLWPVAVSADGNRIAFTSRRTDLTSEPRNPFGLQQVFVLDVAGSFIVQVSDMTHGTRTSGPVAISADGNRVAWEQDISVHVFDIATGERLAIGPGASPTLNHDGTRVAFIDGNGALSILDMWAGSQGVVFASDRGLSFPVMSASGDRVAFVSSADPVGENPDLDTEVFLLDVGGVRQLTHGIGSRGASPVRIDRDGTAAVFADERDLIGPNPDGGSEIYLWSMHAVSRALTSAGTSVTATLAASLPDGSTGSIRVTFDQVISAGITTATILTSGAPPPQDFEHLQPPAYYVIETTAEFSGPIEACFTWVEGRAAEEERLRLFQAGAQGWIDVTTSVDPIENRICGMASELATFAIFAPTLPPGECTWTLRQITDGPEQTGDVSISGDGTRVVFLKFFGNDPVITLFDTASNSTRGIATGWTPVLSAEGNRVAFIDMQNNLALVDVASGETMTWTLGPLRLPISVNADGTRIAFVPEQSDAAEEPQVSVLEVATGAVRRVSNAASDVALPVISAAGTRVVWVEDWADLKMFDFNTNEIVTIAPGFWPTLDYYGTRVAYVNHAGTELRMADTTTGEDRVLLSSDRGFSMPSMSADAKRLMFWSSGDFTGGNADLDGELFILDIMSGGVTQLTSGAGNSALPIAGLSAHGSRVAFSDFRPLVEPNPEGNFEVFLAACGPAAPPLVYEFGGFEPPLRPDGSASIRQGAAGRTIPVKFSLRLNGEPVTTAVASIALHQVLDTATGSVDVTDLTADAGAANDNGPLFRVDPATLQYVYNLSTANLAANATYRISVTLDDGGVYTVDFSLR